MGFVCRWELFATTEKKFLLGDTSLPLAEGELRLPLLELSSLGPAKPHTRHPWCNRGDHAAHEMFLCPHTEILREIRQDF